MVVGELTTAVDVMVIGGGPAGVAAALAAAAMGKETVLAVRGTPLSKAPSVSLLWACWRRRASLLREARTVGLPPAPEAASWAALAPDCVAEALAAQQRELAALAAAGALARRQSGERRRPPRRREVSEQRRGAGDRTPYICAADRNR